ncbi:thioesterase II family protein [Kitasatospora sp. NPDC056184]|uniref:thioesterase II family protein n=1 Tax=Kitasatospora sp. NPDC056184 TaxID=3345738 RepID=UPI0035DEB5FD
MAELTIDSSLWLRPLRPAPNPANARVRLLCFPHAGGSASFFRPLAGRFDADVDVQAVQYPGRQDRRAEPALEDIGLLADRIHEAFRPPEGLPYAFFGHSLGAVVAFEVARRLERDGERTPVVLFASARRAPSRAGGEQVHLLDDDQVVAEIQALSGTSADLLLDDELVRMVLPAIRSDYRAIETYRLSPDATPLSTPIVALIGGSDPRVDVEESAAWSEHTSAGFDLQVFPGGHFYLSDRPTEASVATAVTTHLRSRL